MNLTEVMKAAGAHRRGRRVGRGESSGAGKTSGRGNKGAGQRASWGFRLFHEGGAFPLFRRVAKRGFSNVNFRTEYQVVNLGDVSERFSDGGHVTAATLYEVGLVSDPKGLLKILGDGDLKRKLTFEAERFSKQAAAKIEAAGGSLKRLGPQPKKKFIKRPPDPAAAAAAAEAKGKGGKAGKGKKKSKGEEGELEAAGA